MHLQVLDGRDLLSERTNAELKYLKKAIFTFHCAPLCLTGFMLLSINYLIV